MSTYLDTLLDTAIRWLGVALPKRPAINLTDADLVTPFDDIENNQTTLTILKPNWRNVGFDDSPYTAVRANPWIGLEFTSTGTIEVRLWPGQEGDIVILDDVLGAAGAFATLVVTAHVGERLAASGGGAFANEQGFGLPGMTVRLKFRLSDKTWLLW